MYHWCNNFHGSLVEVELGGFCLVGRVCQLLHDMPHDMGHHRFWAKQASTALEAHGLLVLLLLMLQGTMCQWHMGAKQGKCDESLLAQGAYEARGKKHSVCMNGF